MGMIKKTGVKFITEIGKPIICKGGTDSTRISGENPEMSQEAESWRTDQSLMMDNPIKKTDDGKNYGNDRLKNRGVERNKILRLI